MRFSAHHPARPEDRKVLAEQYREIGPAAILAALLATRKGVKQPLKATQAA